MHGVLAGPWGSVTGQPPLGPCLLKTMVLYLSGADVLHSTDFSDHVNSNVDLSTYSKVSIP